MDLIAMVSLRTWLMLGCIVLVIVVYYVVLRRRRSQTNYPEKSQS